MKYLQIIDLKTQLISISFVGIMGLPLSGSFWGDLIKVLCGIVYLGYLIRRWWIMEVKFKNNNNDDISKD